MLPSSAIDPAKGAENPCMVVDTGLPSLFHECYKAGALKQRLIVKVAGGACVNGDSDNDYFQIGKRNFVVLRQLLWKNGVLIKAHDVGGSCSRTLSLDIASGQVSIRSNGVMNPL
jgi:chemotaxis protein CheD